MGKYSQPVQYRQAGGVGISLTSNEWKDRRTTSALKEPIQTTTYMYLWLNDWALHRILMAKEGEDVSNSEQNYETLLISLYVIAIKPGATGTLNFTVHDPPRSWLKNYLCSALIVHLCSLSCNVRMSAIYCAGSDFSNLKTKLKPYSILEQLAME